jgi:hypothetical protein
MALWDMKRVSARNKILSKPQQHRNHSFGIKWHNQCIISSQVITTRMGEAVILDGAMVVNQLMKQLPSRTSNQPQESDNSRGMQ